MTGASLLQVMRHHQNGTDVLLLARPIYTVQGTVLVHPNNKFSGLLVFTIPLQRFQDKLLRGARFGQNGIVWAMTDQGLFVGTGHTQHLGKTVAEVWPSPSATRDSQDILDVVARMRAGEEGMRSEEHTSELKSHSF